MQHLQQRRIRNHAVSDRQAAIFPSTPQPLAVRTYRPPTSPQPAAHQTELAFRALSAPSSTPFSASDSLNALHQACPALALAGQNRNGHSSHQSTLPLKRRHSAANQRTVLSLHAPIPSFPLTSQARSLVLSVVLLPLPPFALSSNLFALTKHYVSSILLSYNSIDHLTALSPTRIHHDSHRYNTCASQSRRRNTTPTLLLHELKGTFC